MIQPRPTTHISAEPFGLYTIGARVEQWGRADAWCACGAKLSRYRSLGDISCAPCQLAKQVDPFELHPDIPKNERWRLNQGKTCPVCNGDMDRRAKTCKHCRHAVPR